MSECNNEEFEQWWQQHHVPLNMQIHIDEAVSDFAKKIAMAAWLASRQPPEANKVKPVWDMELMYKHRGEKFPRFLNLGQSTKETRSEAILEGRIKAECWLTSTFKKGIESWEVKVRPVRKN